MKGLCRLANSVPGKSRFRALPLPPGGGNLPVYEALPESGNPADLRFVLPRGLAKPDARVVKGSLANVAAPVSQWGPARPAKIANGGIVHVYSK